MRIIVINIIIYNDENNDIINIIASIGICASAGGVGGVREPVGQLCSG